MTTPDPIRAVGDALRGVDLTAHLDEQILVERVRASDPLAFEAIFRQYHEELCVVAEYVAGSRATAEDVVQDIFLKIWKSRERWNVNTSLRAYLRRAARNAALRKISSAAARRHQSLSGEIGGITSRGPALVDPEASPQEQVEAAVMADEVAQVAANLPPRAREVYGLSRDAGLSIKEIAEQLRISPKTVEQHMTRALAVIRATVARWRED